MAYRIAIRRLTVVLMALLFVLWGVLITGSAQAQPPSPSIDRPSYQETEEPIEEETEEPQEEPTPRRTPTRRSTRPTATPETADVPDEIFVQGKPEEVVAALQEQGVVPEGGRLLFTFPRNSFARASTPGLKYLLINRSPAQNFVLQFQVGWYAAGSRESGCGIGFRRAEAREVTVLILGTDQKVSLFQQNGTDELPINYFEDSKLFVPGRINWVTIIAIDEQVTLYLNSKLETTQTGETASGLFELELFNPKNNTKVTTCNYPLGWVWTFDE
jgi:hypothetical protein